MPQKAAHEVITALAIETGIDLGEDAKPLPVIASPGRGRRVAN
jgi:type I restriction enzyme M protein